MNYTTQHGGDKCPLCRNSLQSSLITDPSFSSAEIQRQIAVIEADVERRKMRKDSRNVAASKRIIPFKLEDAAKVNEWSALADDDDDDDDDEEEEDSSDEEDEDEDQDGAEKESCGKWTPASSISGTCAPAARGRTFERSL